MITVLRHSFLQKPPEGSKGHLVSLFAACQARSPSLQPREVLKVGLLWQPLTVIVLRKVVVAALLVGSVQFHARNGGAFFAKAVFHVCLMEDYLLKSPCASATYTAYIFACWILGSKSDSIA